MTTADRRNKTQELMDIPFLQCFVRINSFINVQELVQQSKFSNLYDSKYRYTIKSRP